MKNLSFLVLLFFINLSFGQETIGLIYNDINEEKADGYTLFNPTSDQRVFLIDNCGEVVNQWTFSGSNARNAYLLENGNLLQSSGLQAEIRDWNDNVLWGITYQDVFGWRIHHDIEPLPNGNFLVLVRQSLTDTEMFAQGMNTSYNNPTFVLERIIEIEPVGTGSANIVWEWKLIDHIVQDFDNTKPNFGVVADNPQLYNINYNNGNGSNPIHANAIAYNEDLDQIAVSARHLSEVFVIDHSTTTAEAASDTGGLYGKGGDFLWRWGNPEVYDQGTAADRTLGRQHDIKWITSGPYQGKMSVFSNDGYGNNMTASSVHIIDPNETNGVYSLDSSGKFLPAGFHWSWDGIIMSEVMHAPAQCGFQVLPNGNALINESDIGRITEINTNGEVIWVYRIPVGAGVEYAQFDEPIGNGSFRAHRYASNYPGFNGVTFNNTGIIENTNSISDDCIATLSISDTSQNNLEVYPNPTKDVVYFNKMVEQASVYDLSGKVVLNQVNSESINLETLAEGIYIIKISDDSNVEHIKILKTK
jgi:hypothetical protein